MNEKKNQKVRGWFPSEPVDSNAVCIQTNRKPYSKRTIYACNCAAGFGTVILVMGTADLLGLGSYGPHAAGFATGIMMVVVNLFLFRNSRRK